MISRGPIETGVFQRQILTSVAAACSVAAGWWWAFAEEIPFATLAGLMVTVEDASRILARHRLIQRTLERDQKRFESWYYWHERGYRQPPPVATPLPDNRNATWFLILGAIIVVSCPLMPWF